MARRRGIGCPRPLRARTPRCTATVPVCSTFVGGAGVPEPLPLEDQTFVQITKCCDDTAGDGVGDTTFFKIFVVDGTGAIQSQQIVDGGGVAYEPVSEVPCGIETDLEIIEKCFQLIADPTVRFSRLTLLDVTNQEIDGVVWTDMATGLIVPAPAAGEIEECDDPFITSEIARVSRCDQIDAENIICYTEAFKVECVDGVITSTSLGLFTNDSLSEEYTPINPVDCDQGNEACLRDYIMCDGGTTFIRVVDIFTGTVVFDYDEAFAPYIVTGTPTIGVCNVEPCKVEMCDDGVNFFRVFDLNTGNILRQFDLNGAPYTPSGAETIGICKIETYTLVDEYCVTP